MLEDKKFIKAYENGYDSAADYVYSLQRRINELEQQIVELRSLYEIS